MKINHIAIWTSDLEKMKSFYSKYFDGILSEKYLNEKKGFESYFISFESSSRIELMKNAGLIKNKKTHDSYGFTHIAFSLGTREKVIELTETLRSAGYVIQSEPRTTGDGYFESCILDPEENIIEITA
jgi:lactoylglutathione lyase